MTQNIMYRVNGHEFEIVNEYTSAEVLQCRECLAREVLQEENDAEDYLERMTPECHIELLRKPDGNFHGVALRNAQHFRGRELLGIKEDGDDLEVVDSIRIYDDDTPQLASLLDKQTWDDRASAFDSE